MNTTSSTLPRALWALMVGNFVIGTGVMVVPGTLNDISVSLGVSIPQAGPLGRIFPPVSAAEG